LFHIIFDLEFVVMRKQQYLADIIEIGAIKISDHNQSLEIVDMFQTFVKPDTYKVLSKETTAFTGITQSDISQAPSFSNAVKSFREWIGQNEYYLWAWGQDDKYQLVRHCREHKQPIDWIVNYNDLQKQFFRTLSEANYRQVGLKKALEILEIDFEGSHHRAIHDAYNTAKIFMRIFPSLVMEKNCASDEDLYITRSVYKTGDHHFYPFADLAKLFENNQ
jgi:inhibitor of KinA sporulation pathway (predicted exonuclease)